MTKNDKISVFANELRYIKDDNLRAFGKELIGNADDYFFAVPASSSGKYHPTFSLGPGGLTRHTRCVAYFAMGGGESYNFDQHTTDLLVLAALAHDIKKQGNGDTGHTVREHPLLGAQYVLDMQKANPTLISQEDAEKIASAIRAHMGKWEGTREWVKDESKELFPLPKDGFEQALQYADYVASRKYILDFQFDDTEKVEIPDIMTENKKTTRDVNSYTLAELENYIVPFGKNAGSTFKEVEPKGYLFWVTSQPDFNAVDIQSLAKRYLLLIGGKCGPYPLDVTLEEAAPNNVQTFEPTMPNPQMMNPVVSNSNNKLVEDDLPF